MHLGETAVIDTMRTSARGMATIAGHRGVAPNLAADVM